MSHQEEEQNISSRIFSVEDRLNTSGNDAEPVHYTFGSKPTAEIQPGKARSAAGQGVYAHSDSDREKHEQTDFSIHDWPSNNANLVKRLGEVMFDLGYRMRRPFARQIEELPIELDHVRQRILARIKGEVPADRLWRLDSHFKDEVYSLSEKARHLQSRLDDITFFKPADHSWPHSSGLSSGENMS